MPSWPRTLPQAFDVSGFRDELPERLVRSELDGGREKFRQRAERSNYAPIAGRISIEQSDWDSLLLFYEDILKDGALAFDFPDPDNNADTIPVAFTKPPELTTIGGNLYGVRLELERQD